MRLSRLTFLWLVALGLLVQGPASWLRGTVDVLTFKRWALQAADAGPLVYRLSPMATRAHLTEPPDYPPLALAILTTARAAAEAVEPQLVPTSRVFTIAIKGLLILARLTTLFGIVWVVAAATDSLAIGRLAGLAFWLNPALILAGPALGYLDAACMLPGMASMVCAARRRWWAAGALAAISALIKPQGLFYFVPLASMAWRATGPERVRATAAAGVVLAGVLGPFLVWTPRGILAGLSANFHEDLLSGDALNLWWILSAGGRWMRHGVTSLTIPLTPLSLAGLVERVHLNPRWVMAAVVIAAAAAIAYRLRGCRDITRQAAGAALMIHIYFSLAISVHENHLTYALPLLVVAAAANRRFAQLYVALSALVLVNLVVLYGVGRDFPRFDRIGPAFWCGTIAASAAGLAALVWHTRIFLRVSAPYSATSTGVAASTSVSADGAIDTRNPRRPPLM